MLTRLTVVGVLAVALGLGAQSGAAGQERSPSLDSAFAAYWRAPDPPAAAAAARQVLATGAEFAAIYERLKAGRPYAFGRVDDLTTRPTLFAPAATISRARRDMRGLWHPFLIMVPPSYNPSKPYPVRMYLQGDTTRPASSAESGAGWPDYSALARDDAIVVFPGAWNGFGWWDASQVEHMAAVLDEVKGSYNVDENRVFLLGSSDGGTGIYYHAMVAPTLWAGYLPFNADPSVLADPKAVVDTQLYASNLAGQALYVVHGGRDQIFPSAGVAAWLGLFESAGARLEFQLKADYGHETRWWADEAPSMDRFINDHPRNPLPDTVVWETAQADRANRAWWVVVDELGVTADQTADIGPNAVMSTSPGIGVGVWREVAGQGVQIGLVQPESPAAVAGLREDDVIVQAGTAAVSTFAAVESALRAAAGSSLALVVKRDGSRQPLTLAVPPAAPDAAIEAYPHPRPGGRVQVQRQGNAIDVRTRGVKRLTLLLSPDRFDFSRPITVVANGSMAFEGMLTPSAGVLMKWAARDNDRTMLFAQEIELRLP